MSEPTAVPAVFPRVAPPGRAPGWMQARSTAVAPVAFRRHGAPPEHVAPGSIRPPSMAPPPEPEVDPIAEAHEAIEAARAEAEAAVAEAARLRADVDVARAELRAAAEALAVADARLAEDAQESLLELAVIIAEAILGRALEADPAQHVVLARAALAPMRGEGSVELHASPATHRALVDAVGGTVLHDGAHEVPIVLDERLEGHGCVVRAGLARVDGRIEERLASVREALLHAHRTGAAGPSLDPEAG